MDTHAIFQLHGSVRYPSEIPRTSSDVDWDVHAFQSSGATEAPPDPSLVLIPNSAFRYDYQHDFSCHNTNEEVGSL